MRAQIAHINIDKLKICFLSPAGFDERIRDEFITNNGQDIDMGDYILSRGLHDSDTLTIHLYVPIDGQQHCIGRYIIHCNGKYAPYVFFELDNRALYTEFSEWDGHKVNLAVIIEDISLDLGLRFNNITTVELSMDTNINVLAKVRKALRNTERYDMVMNNNKITDPYKVIPGYSEMYGGSRVRLSRIPTLYFRQRRDDGLKLKIYNKSTEMAIASPGKESYIPKWNGITNANIYRVEATIKNEYIKHFCRINGIPTDEALCRLITDERFRNSLWANSVSSVLHFSDKATGKRVDIIDLCE